MSWSISTLGVVFALGWAEHWLSEVIAEWVHEHVSERSVGAVAGGMAGVLLHPLKSLIERGIEWTVHAWAGKTPPI